MLQEERASNVISQHHTVETGITGVLGVLGWLSYDLDEQQLTWEVLEGESQLSSELCTWLRSCRKASPSLPTEPLAVDRVHDHSASEQKGSPWNVPWHSS